MGKKRAVNKTKAILDYKAANPEAGPSEISEALQKKKIEVSAAYISTILSKDKAKNKAQKAVARAETALGDSGTMELVRMAAALLDGCGSPQEAKKMIDVVVAARNL